MNRARVKYLFNYDNGKLFWKNLSSKYSNKLIGKEFGAINKCGYIEGYIDNKKLSAHRVVFLYFNGYLPEFVDHIDGDKTNNKIENLRSCTKSENNQNAKTRKDNKSGVKGVYWSSSSNKWAASIQVNKKRIHVGYFSDLSKAKKAIKKARESTHKLFCNHG